MTRTSAGPAAAPERLEKVTGQALRTPRAAAIAGIVFALLFTTSMGLMRLAVPESPTEDTFEWLTESRGSVRFALNLVPFVGIAFLWFLGVLRDRLGQHEDRFFSTVFFGSGLLFLAMVFISAALAAGILAVAEHGDAAQASDAVAYGREVIYAVMNVYAVRMAGVFMLSLSTIWLRTRILPRPIALATLLLAVVMLFAINLSLWIIMIFPAWVMGISIFILVKSLRTPDGDVLLPGAAGSPGAERAGAAS
jgi:hypothetical protein